MLGDRTCHHAVNGLPLTSVNVCLCLLTMVSGTTAEVEATQNFVPVPIRLASGSETSSSVAGRLEVYYNGRWGTVCQNIWKEAITYTVCRILGYSQGTDLPSDYFERGTAPAWLSNVRCSGNETDIAQCPNDGWEIRSCSYTLGLVCFNPDPQERLLTRLVDGRRGSNYITGRLEVFIAGLWGTVCDNNFDPASAPVICRTLGYRNGNQVPKGRFGRVEKPIWTDNVQCLGNETNISQCLRGNWRVGSCYSFEHMGLLCYNKPFSGSVQTRLVGGGKGADWQMGWLDVYFAGQWGTVCSNKFNIAAATVVCRSIGFRFGNFVPRSIRWFRNEMIWLGGAICRGNETNIAECEHDGWGNHFCRHGSDVRIICSNSLTGSNPCFLSDYSPCNDPSKGCFNSGCNVPWRCPTRLQAAKC